jgi:hypothetical protein
MISKDIISNGGVFFERINKGKKTYSTGSTIELRGLRVEGKAFEL